MYGALFLFFLFLTLSVGDIAGGGDVRSIPLSQVINDTKARKVSSIEVSDTKLSVTYRNGQKAQSQKEPNSSIYDVLKSSNVDASGVNISVRDNAGITNWIGIISNILPIILMVAFFYFIFRQARGAQESIFSFGSSKARAFSKDFPNVTFADVAGIDEAKQEMSEVVDFLKHSEKYRAMGARTPKGVLLVGPSGTGKTLLARAVAGEARTAFFSIAGSEFMEMLVGVGAARVRDLFGTAKKAQPAIIFIDEVDAIGRQRGVGIMGGHDEREQTLNQILVEMDGFAPTEQLVVIAATNRPDVLDPALVRPGRFDRRVVIGLPDLEGRKEILSIHAKGKPFVKDVDWDRVARRTVGFSGADLENMLNEAAILAARDEKKEIDMVDIEEAATKVKLGPQKKRMQSEEDRRITAYHEGGHALVGRFMPHMDRVHKISIVSRGLTLGHTMFPPMQDRVHETRTRLLEQIAAALGGRAAEEMIFSEMTTGAGNDIENATQIARAMVVDFGMSRLGPINLGEDKGRAFYETTTVSDEMKYKIDEEIKRIMDEGYAQAQKILSDNKAILDRIADALMEKETLDGDEFEAIVKGNGEVKSKRKTTSPKIRS